jgi:branched-chain amino acid transport system permease protein
MSAVKRVITSRSLTVGALIVVGLALVVVPLMVDLSNYILTLMVMLLIHIMLSESWNLMAGYAGQVNLGMAAYFGTGSLCYTLAYVKVGAPMYVAFVVGGLAATALACIIGPPTLRLKGAYFGIGTMALAEVVRLVATTTFALPIYPPASYWATFTLTKSYYVALAVAMATIAVAYGVTHSRLGMALQAMRDDEDAANASGINPAKYKMIVFMISSFLAGVAGAVFGFHRGNPNIPAQFTMDWTIGAIVSVTIGGWGTLTGPVLGSTVFVILKEILGRTFPTAYLVVTGIIFVVVVVFLPDGLVSIGAVIRRFLASARKPKPSVSKHLDSVQINGNVQRPKPH